MRSLFTTGMVGASADKLCCEPAVPGVPPLRSTFTHNNKPTPGRGQAHCRQNARYRLWSVVHTRRLCQPENETQTKDLTKINLTPNHSGIIHNLPSLMSCLIS